MCHYLENWYDSVNKYFADDQCITLQNQASVKIPLNGQTSGFSATKWERFVYTFQTAYCN